MSISHNKKQLATYFLFSFLLLIFQLSLVSPVLSWDEPFNNAANWLGTGLLESPNARILEDGEMRIGFSQALPYRWYGGGMGILPGLEFTGRVTELNGISSGLGDDYGDYKDKAFDLKFQIIGESKKWPAVAIGLNDFIGTRLFSSEYVALSRQYFPLDISIGYGTKRYNGLFGGIELAVTDQLKFLAEYCPIEYEKDKSPVDEAVPGGASSPFNFGARYRFLNAIDLGVSYQRGDTFGFEVKLRTDLGDPIRPLKPDPPMQIDVDRAPFEERDKGEMVRQIHDSIHEAGFSDVLVYADGKDLVAEFENNQYLYDQKAAGRVLRILLFHAPEDTNNIVAVLKRRDMSILKVSVRPEHFEKFIFASIPEDIFYSKLLRVETTRDTTLPDDTIFAETEKTFKDRFTFGIRPDIDLYLNDPSGFFKFSVGIQPYGSIDLWDGAMVVWRYDIPFYSNISSSNPILPDAVRSDSWLYAGTYSFNNLLLDQMFRVKGNTFGRVTVGYLDKMYAGAGGELLSFLGNGNFAFGVESDWVKKRVPETQFDLKDFDTYTVLGNFYYYYQRLGLTFNTKYGRFLAGDVGWMFDINRQYDTGVKVGAFYTVTDTDIFKDEYNRGYNHKGVYLEWPARLFMGKDSPIRYRYRISPWTRDVGATVYHWRELYSRFNDMMPGEFGSDLDKLKD